MTKHNSSFINNLTSWGLNFNNIEGMAIFRVLGTIILWHSIILCRLVFSDRYVELFIVIYSDLYPVFQGGILLIYRVPT